MRGLVCPAPVTENAGEVQPGRSAGQTAAPFCRGVTFHCRDGPPRDVTPSAQRRVRSLHRESWGGGGALHLGFCNDQERPLSRGRDAPRPQARVSQPFPCTRPLRPASPPSLGLHAAGSGGLGGGGAAAGRSGSCRRTAGRRLWLSFGLLQPVALVTCTYLRSGCRVLALRCDPHLSPLFPAPPPRNCVPPHPAPGPQHHGPRAWSPHTGSPYSTPPCIPPS